MKRFLLPVLLLAGSHVALAVERTELRSDSLEMVSNEEESRALSVGNVVLTGTNLKIVCDRLEIIASRVGDLDGAVPTLEKFKYLLATGNVRIVQGDREATCGRAEVFPREERVVLTEDPVLIDRSSDIVQRGTKIVLFRGEQRVSIENPVLSGPPIKDLGPDARDEPAAPPAP
ncbi:MAG TPA: LptA/OstA family protein [Candidatus Synoicihabitans sp.]|nr:LptA/OstA family protein [Candidatus Synoicihabitans sp.]